VDVADMFGRFTLDVMSTAAFGQSTNCLSDENGVLCTDLRLMFHELDRRMAMIDPLIGYWRSIRLSRDKAFYKAHDRCKEFFTNLIVERRKEKNVIRNDFLSLLLEGEEEWSDDILIQDLQTFLAAGNHTTAMTLSWVIYFLTLYPSVQSKLRLEVDQVLKGEIPTYSVIGNLKYNLNVIKEVMRIKPVAWANPKQSNEEVSCETVDLTIPKGVVVIVNTYAMQNSELYWENPKEFNPDRFNNLEKLNSWAYFPFAKGMRNCVGQKLAMLELQMMTAMMVQNFEMKMAPGHTVKDKIELTLCPNDLIVQLTPRK